MNFSIILKTRTTKNVRTKRTETKKASSANKQQTKQERQLGTFPTSQASFSELVFLLPGMITGLEAGPSTTLKESSEDEQDWKNFPTWIMMLGSIPYRMYVEYLLQVSESL